MKSSLALFIGAAALLTGCGQTGPLYMPKPPAKPAPAPAAQPAIPVIPPSSTPSAQQ
ncbi:MAG TPA: lipoprotein [Telluria sp.]|nr:lipoprotein [Telluria sp.]